ncbi:unnamed protein product [Dibothriocephalus latus]|uniref:Uncharacterized protein n=1 Tax=Dibothriocephalus latus TaxID=60516 RepID=A0A3P7M3K1_DIBLA|nr:unnamed protein product [Dibothriocephalus latus]
MKTEVADRRREWQLMSKKARDWLAIRVKSDISVDELIKEATFVLQAISKAVRPNN